MAIYYVIGTYQPDGEKAISKMFECDNAAKAIAELKKEVKSKTMPEGSYEIARLVEEVCLERVERVTIKNVLKDSA